MNRTKEDQVNQDCGTTVSYTVNNKIIYTKMVLNKYKNINLKKNNLKLKYNMMLLGCCIASYVLCRYSIKMCMMEQLLDQILFQGFILVQGVAKKHCCFCAGLETNQQLPRNQQVASIYRQVTIFHVDYRRLPQPEQSQGCFLVRQIYLCDHLTTARNLWEPISNWLGNIAFLVAANGCLAVTNHSQGLCDQALAIDFTATANNLQKPLPTITHWWLLTM